MRTASDRIRHAILFEGVALAIVAPAGGGLFALSAGHFGVVALVSTGLALLWTFAFNLGFDQVLLRLGQSLHKTVPMRALHATTPDRR